MARRRRFAGTSSEHRKQAGAWMATARRHLRDFRGSLRDARAANHQKHLRGCHEAFDSLISAARTTSRAGENRGFARGKVKLGSGMYRAIIKAKGDFLRACPFQGGR